MLDRYRRGAVLAAPPQAASLCGSLIGSEAATVARRCATAAKRSVPIHDGLTGPRGAGHVVLLLVVAALTCGSVRHVRVPKYGGTRWTFRSGTAQTPLLSRSTVMSW